MTGHRTVSLLRVSTTFYNSFVLSNIVITSLGEEGVVAVLAVYLCVHVLLFEPSREIMVLFAPRKLILQTRMGSYPVGLDVWFLVGPFDYFHTSCLRTAKALAGLRGCASSPEPSLVAYMVSTIISWAGTFHVLQLFLLMPQKDCNVLLWHSLETVSLFLSQIINRAMQYCSSHNLKYLSCMHH